ncbi:hypothetical protein JR044_31270 [Pseudomonas aeruginosa]|jgi:hypothetical protein|uniref:hypothetical protein n=1 Tax=Pseudomonas aeruginosa TaxID=287 RepID=UPI001BD45212|nr:hypothetical protein [Pseudomonas aeruginosa]MBS9758477.1 hypothetical protein [Pseudomonas aeruginosa]
MTTAQQAAIAALQRDGFALEYHGRHVARLARGNDYRLVRQDGTQQRAKGARR